MSKELNVKWAEDEDRFSLLEYSGEDTAPAMRIMLGLDLRDGDVAVFTRRPSQNAIPQNEYYGIVRVWEVPGLVDAVELSKALHDKCSTLRTALFHVYDMVEGVEYPNGRQVIVWADEDFAWSVDGVTDDVASALGRIATLNDTVDDCAGLWAAGDWLQDPVDGITATMSEDAVDRLCTELEEEAREQGIILYDLQVEIVVRRRAMRDRLIETLDEELARIGVDEVDGDVVSSIGVRFNGCNRVRFYDDHAHLDNLTVEAARVFLAALPDDAGRETFWDAANRVEEVTRGA